MQNIIEIISWIGVTQGVLLVLLLAVRRNNKHANRLLAFFIAIIALDCIEPLIFEKGYSGIFFRTWEFLWGGIVFLHGPLLFIYVKKLTTGEKSFVKQDWKHYTLPFIYYAVLIGASIIHLPEEAMDIGTLVIYELFYLHLFTYSVLALRALNHHQRELLLPTNSDQLQEINLSWLKTLLVTTLCLYMVSFTTAQLSIFFPAMDKAPWHLAIQFILAAIMYAISYKSIAQPQLFFRSQPDEKKTNGVSREKYRTSSLDTENAKRIQQKLVLFMEEKKPYLDPNLSLEALAKHLNESRYHISQVINDRLKLKFNDFVNQYRVEEFKQQMSKPRRRKPTVEMLAKLSGFNSKTSFHTVFKKITGMTPSKFYKETIIEKEN